MGREEEELALAAEMGVTRMDIVGFDKPTIEYALELVDKYDQLYATLDGIQQRQGLYRGCWITCWAKTSQVVALGEIGLDYHWMTAKEVQEQVFVVRFGYLRIWICLCGHTVMR